jgi:hypothetical protein
MSHPMSGRRIPRVVAALVGALVWLAAAPKPAPAAKPRPSLAVMIAVDGLGWPRLAQYRPWFVAGFKRLLDEGHIETACHYRHLNTETGPGHASIGTGTPPRVHGIVGNAWYQRDDDGTARRVYCADTAGTDANGKKVPGAENLQVPTLGDRLVETYPGSRVVSVSGKDRSAIFLAGRDRRHAPYWFRSASGELVTSPAYAPPDGVQKLVARFNASIAGAKLVERFGLEWKPLPVPDTEASARPTAVPGPLLLDYQIPAVGLGWNHSLSGRRNYGSALSDTPFADTLLADIVLELLASDELALGRGKTPDMLGISFSSHDHIAHDYGPESEEALDALRRLDVELGRVLDAIEARIGKERVVLGLSADHGFAPIPEAARARDAKYAGGRLVDGRRTMTDFVQRLDRHLAQELCLPEGTRTLLGNHGWTLSYDRAAFPLRTAAGPCGEAGREVGARDIDRLLPAAARRLYAEEIEGVWLVSERERWPADHPATEYVRNAVHDGRSGDALLVPRPGVMMHWDPGRGSTHGTHLEHDTHVPLVFWGAFAPRESAEAATPYDLAPTLAARLGVDLKAAEGRPRR